MFYRTIFLALLLLTVFQTTFAQTPEIEKPKVVTDELRKEAVAFLRETSGEVNSLRSLENRISFSSEMAGLMWFHDEKEAGAMYQTVISDFKQLMVSYDAEMNSLGITPNEGEYNESFFGGGDQTEKSRLTRKFFKALSVRQQVAMSLAEHDATLAYGFFYDTLNIVSNVEFRKQIEQRDSYFEVQLMKKIALKDAAKAAEFGRKSLAKGVNWSHLELLKKIYEKDSDKGAEFGEEIVKKLKSDKTGPSDLYSIVSFMNAGAESLEKVKKEGGKKPMFSEQSMRDMAEILAQGMLQRKDTREMNYDSYAALVEKYAPARAAQLRAKFSAKTAPVKPKINSDDSEDTPVTVPPLNSVGIQNKKETENQARKEQTEMMKNVQTLGSKQIPKEEREKVVAQARKIIGGMGKKEEKIMALSMLASQVSKLGDKELAADILKDAQALVNPSPKNYRDFLETWFLISAYAETDPDKAFPMLDDAIFRLNDTLSAFIKVGEFIDASGEMIDDGEVQVGSFGGSMISSLTGELGIANATLRNLAIADFGKTKAITNRFDRTEVRILAKMLILRAILGDKTKDKIEESEIGLTTQVQ